MAEKEKTMKIVHNEKEYEFLASELSAWVTGTTINLDGGALAAGGWYRDPNNFWTNVPVITGNGFNF